MAHWEAMGVSRPLPAGLVFPFDWGFIPSTCGPDGDPIDACVIWDVASFPGVVIVCRTIGVLNAEQNAANFEQIIPALVIIQANVRTPAFHTSCS